MKKGASKEIKRKHELLNYLAKRIETIDNEIKSDVTPAIIASFGFIIALIWRDAIKGALDHFLLKAGLTEKAYLYNFVSAIIVTIVVMTIMIFASNYSKRKKKKNLRKMVKNEIENIDEK
jgi:uncharacterized membrane protein